MTTFKLRHSTGQWRGNDCLTLCEQRRRYVYRRMRQNWTVPYCLISALEIVGYIQKYKAPNAD